MLLYLAPSTHKNFIHLSFSYVNWSTFFHFQGSDSKDASLPIDAKAGAKGAFHAEPEYDSLRRQLPFVLQKNILIKMLQDAFTNYVKLH